MLGLQYIPHVLVFNVLHACVFHFVTFVTLVYVYVYFSFLVIISPGSSFSFATHVAICVWFVGNAFYTTKGRDDHSCRGGACGTCARWECVL